jgi:hypothetical protein
MQLNFLPGKLTSPQKDLTNNKDIFEAFSPSLE